MLERLLEALNSRDKETSAAALREVDALEPPELLRLLELESTDYKRRGRKCRALNVVAFLLFMLLASGSWELAWLFVKLSKDQRFFLMISRNVAYCLFYFCLRRASERFESHIQVRNDLAELLSRKEDMHLLFAAFRLGRESATEEVKATIRSALKAQLPQLRVAQVAKWTKAQKQALLLPLETPLQDAELTLLLLKTLEQVGDAHAIPSVRKLTKLGSWGAYQDVRNAERINRAAEACLPYLEERIEPTQHSDTLLRPSDIAQVAAPDTLLRPAYSLSDTPPEQLLRPGVKEEA